MDRPSQHDRSDGDGPADAWYLYGVVPADGEIDLDGCTGCGGDEPVELVPVANLCAIVSRMRHDGLPDGADSEALTLRITEHDAVIRAAQASGRSVVPLPFGLVVADRDELRRRIDAHAGELHEALERLEGCDEWGVHVSVPREAAQRAVRACARAVYEQLATLAEDAVIEPVNAGAREARPSILSAAYLVNRDRAEGFQRMARHLAEHWDLGGFTVALSGPWPPYHFARVTLGVRSPAAAVLLGPLSEPDEAWAARSRPLIA
jgi:hypothetical protein